MLKVTPITVPVFSCLLIVSSTAFADSRTLKGSEKEIASLFSTYSQGCQNASFLTNLEIYFGKGERNRAKSCDQRELNDKLASILSYADDEKLSDSSYREWYVRSLRKLRLIVNPVQPALVPTSQGIKRYIIRSNVINGPDKSPESRVPTAKGYQTLGSN